MSYVPYLDVHVRASTSSPFLPTPLYRMADILGRSFLYSVPSLAFAVI